MREVLLLCWRDSTHPQGGGSERYLEEVGTRLAARGIKVTLRTAHHPGAARREVRDGITIIRSGGRFTVYVFAMVALVLGRFGLGSMRDVRPDAIIDTQNGMPFFARLVTRVPVTVLVHHGHREQWPVAGRLVGRIGWFIESVLSPRAHRTSQYLTVSLPSAEELTALGVEASRIAVVRNGIEAIPAGVPVSDPTAEPTICVLSRLVPHKQIEDALRLVGRIRYQVPGVRLDVIGDGWWSPNLHEYAHSIGVADRVRFHGHVSEERKHELLSQAWLHVMPSRKEGWGLAVIEAAQHEVPTIGYRSSRGLTDSIIDGVTGILADDHDHLCAAAVDLLRDDTLRESMGRKAALRSDEFSWDACTDGVTAVLEASIAGSPVSGLVSAAEDESNYQSA
ncbi:glycosyltransferase family 4 protein [Smaragdicoccus niigatensis]|uniref:glycosyltransferase family 4 protein n=1 Tax=Smaragdicoccus niigatensis TaxID=359359 RepID=UPI0003659F55|nr:glycosyltransferase family 4 protein [Smaragdicoccus niigatensis]